MNYNKLIPTCILILLCSIISVNSAVYIPKIVVFPDFADAPFIEVNVPVNFTLSVQSAANPSVKISDLSSSNVFTDGVLIPFYYSNQHYSEILQYNTTGSTRFQTLFLRTNSTIRQLNFNVSIVEYINLTVELFEDVNLTDHYSDNKAYIIAYPILSTDYDFSMYRKLANTFDSASKLLGNKVEEAVGIDLSEFIGVQLYLYSEKVFIAPLNNGIAIVELPKGFKYNVRIFSPSTTQNFILLGNRYKEMYFKSFTYDLSIEKSLVINNATTLKAIIAREETHPFWYWSSKIIMFLLILGTIGLPFLVMSSTSDALLAVKAFIGMLVLTLLSGICVLIINWVVY